jgi:hypothetical protein
MSYSLSHLGSNIKISNAGSLGNVGIGTDASASYKLHISCNFATLTNDAFPLKISAGSASTVTGKGTFLGLGTENLSFAKCAIGHVRNAANDRGDMVFLNRGAGDAVGCDTTNEIMRITNSNVGILKTNPSSAYALDVNGAINSTGLFVNGTAFVGGGGTGSQWVTSNTNSTVYITSNVVIGSNVAATNRLDVYNGDINVVSGNVEKSTTNLDIQRVFKPDIWYQFNEDPINSTVLYDSNSTDVKYNMNIIKYDAGYLTSNVSIPSTQTTDIFDDFTDDTTGLVCWYQFNNGALLTDSSGNSRTLTNLYNNNIRIDSSDYVRGDACALFDGGFLYRDETTNNGIFSPQSITVSVFCKLVYPGIGAINTIAATIKNKAGWRILLFGNNNTTNSELAFQTLTGTNDAQGYPIWYIVSVILAANNYGNWIHLAGTYNSADKSQKLYLNGILVSSMTTANLYNITPQSGGSDTYNGGLYIGSLPDPSFFIANLSKLDDFRLYNRALTDTQINMLAKTNKYNIVSPSYSLTTSLNDTTNLICWYQFSDDIRYDSSGNSNYAYVLASTVKDTTDLIRGNASASFTANGFIVSENINVYLSNFTIAFFGKLVHNYANNFTNDLQFLVKVSNGTNEFTLRFKSESTYATILTSSVNKSNVRGTVAPAFNISIADLNKWNHIAVSCTSSSPPTCKLYLNGVLMSSVTDVNLSYSGANSALVIGDDGALPLKAGTKINDFRLYNRVLTDNEIYVLSQYQIIPLKYKSTPIYSSISSNIDNRLVAWYKFDSNLGITSNSAVGTYATANTLTNNNSIGNSTFNVLLNNSDYRRGISCAQFQNVSYFEVSNDGKFSPNDLTIACWCKLNQSANTYQCIASCMSEVSGNTNAFNGWALNIYKKGTNHNIVFETANSINKSNRESTDGRTESIYRSFVTSTAKWRHIAITLSKSGTSSPVHIYIDGYLLKTVNRNYANSTGGVFRIGAGHDATLANNYYLSNNSLLDDFRIYSRVLTVDEIKQIVGYNLEKRVNTTSSYLYQNAYVWDNDIKTNTDNVYLEYGGSSENIRLLLHKFHIENGFNIHFVMNALNTNAPAELLYIGNNYSTTNTNNIIRTYLNCSNLVLQVGNSSVISQNITSNVNYVANLRCAISGYPKYMTLSTSLYDGKDTNINTSTALYNDVLSRVNVRTSNLVYWIGKNPNNSNDAAPVILQDFRLFSTQLTSNDIIQLNYGSNIYNDTNTTLVERYAPERWKDSSTYNQVNGSNYIYYTDGNVGIGTVNPNGYMLNVNGTVNIYNQAIFKDGLNYQQNNSTTWAQSSDIRIKENIEIANYDLCYSNISNLDLFRFSYKSNFRTFNDEHQLGFIAQEYKKICPKNISYTYNVMQDGTVIPDLMSIDVGQINFTLYGAVKKMMKIIEEQNARINHLESLINNTQTSAYTNQKEK